MNADTSYLSDFGIVLLFLIGGASFIALSLLVSKIIRPNKPNPEKLATYESGEEAISTAWPQFNIRFYVIALMFILFEIELVFLFPWALVFADEEAIAQTQGGWMWFTLLEVVTFVLILFAGLVYAWKEKHFNWGDTAEKTEEIPSPVPMDLYQKINERYQ